MPASKGDLATRADVERLVADFYRQAIPDPLLGPVFHAARVDWATHLPRIADFWARELLAQPGYRGNLATAHRRVHELAPFGRTELDRWVELFEETVDAAFGGPVAEHAKRRAHEVAAAVQGAIERRPLTPKGAP